MCIFLQSALPAQTRTANSGFKPLISLHRFRGVLHLVFLPKHSNYSRPPPSTTRPTLHCMKFLFSKNLYLVHREDSNLCGLIIPEPNICVHLHPMYFGGPYRVRTCVLLINSQLLTHPSSGAKRPSYLERW